MTDDVGTQQDRIARAVHSAKETRRTGLDDLIDDGDNEAKMYPLAVPTRLEQQYMAAARKRQKANILQKQVVWGKEFKGVAFFPKPAMIQFKDFDVGKTYTRKIVLTNISYTFNNFKLLQLDDSIRDFFEITYPLQGAMSAGTSCVITIVFTPKLNEDIITELPALAKTGPFSIPLVCTTKKVAIEVNPPNKIVPFGQVVLAESMTQVITIINDGALKTSFDIVGEALQYTSRVETEHDALGMSASHLSTSQFNVSYENVDDNGTGGELSDEEPQHNCLSLKPNMTTDIEVEAFSQVKVAINFHPTQVCTLDTYLILRFADSFTEDHTIFITGQGVDIPVFVYKRNVVDLQCCYYGTLYRDIAVLKSRGKTSMRCQPLVPGCLKKYLSFVPKIGFIQPGKTIDFQMKFVPESDIRQTAARFWDEESEELVVPIQVDVQGQAMPIHFTIRTKLTSSALIFEPQSLDFGAVSVHEGMKLPICVTNSSSLEQQIGFIGPPPEISIKPKDGFYKFLPNETATFEVEFHPSQCRDYNFSINIKTDRNEDYVLPIRALGRPAPVIFSHPSIRMKYSTLGETAEANFMLTNTSKQKQRFMFDVPPHSGLTLKPSCAEIMPGCSEPGLVQFKATPEIFEPPSAAELAKLQEEFDETIKLAKSPDTAKGGKGKKGQKSDADMERELKENQEREQRMEELKAQVLNDREELRMAWQSSLEGEPWSFHRTFQIPCHVSGWEMKALFLEVQVSVMLPALLAELVIPPPTAQELAAMEAAKNDTKGKKKPPAKKGKDAGKPEAGDAEPAPVEDPAKNVLPTINYADPAVFLSGQVQQLQQIRFGDVPSGKSVTQIVLFRHIYAQKGYESCRASLMIEPLDPYGPFSIIQPPEPINPGEVCEVIVQFKPNSEALFVEELRMNSSHKQTIAIKLMGRGLLPALQFSQNPPHALDTDMQLYLNLGSALAGETVERNLTFHNPCTFDLPYEIQFRLPTVEPYNWNGTLPFSIRPFTSIIPKESSITVTVSFNPDHQFEFFRATVDVFFGREDAKKTIFFAGSGWNQGMFLTCPTGIDANATHDIVDPLPTPPRRPRKVSQVEDAPNSTRPPSGRRQSNKTVPEAKSVIPGLSIEEVQDLIFWRTEEEDPFEPLMDWPKENKYILEFNCNDIGQTVSHTIFFGNNKSADPKKGGAGGEYYFDGLTDLDTRYGWKVDPMRSAVEAGGKRQATISFTPSSLVLSSMPVHGITVVVMANVRCTLKGGLPAGGATSSEIVYNFLLKGAVKVNAPT